MNVLFVCSGNLCRSPTAEHVLKRLLEERGIDRVRVSSTGTVAIPGNPVAPLAKKIALDHGIDIGDQKTVTLNEEWIRWADRILIMQPNHRERVLWKDPTADPKIELLADYFPENKIEEILDPYGQEEEAYRVSFDQIHGALVHWMDRWFGPDQK
jgi:protein-tyrosine phosphatase